jgi:hypothetical protein
MRSGDRCRQRVQLALDVAQHIVGALAAATAAGTDTELERELIERTHAIGGALANGFLGDGVADADVHAWGLLDEKNYH